MANTARLSALAALQLQYAQQLGPGTANSVYPSESTTGIQGGRAVETTMQDPRSNKAALSILRAHNSLRLMATGTSSDLHQSAPHRPVTTPCNHHMGGCRNPGQRIPTSSGGHPKADLRVPMSVKQLKALPRDKRASRRCTATRGPPLIVDAAQETRTDSVGPRKSRGAFVHNPYSFGGPIYDLP